VTGKFSNELLASESDGAGSGREAIRKTEEGQRTLVILSVSESHLLSGCESCESATGRNEGEQGQDRIRFKLRQTLFRVCAMSPPQYE